MDKYSYQAQAEINLKLSLRRLKGLVSIIECDKRTQTNSKVFQLLDKTLEELNSEIAIVAEQNLLQ